jgi:hypothetical protein
MEASATSHNTAASIDKVPCGGAHDFAQTGCYIDENGIARHFPERGLSAWRV